MSLKMKELVSQTGESKSTILYYVKEGLLPEPEKPKPNVHLYDEKCVKIIKFIKYLQNNLSYSIAQIQTIMQLNNFSFDASFENLIQSLEHISGIKSSERYTEKELLELVDATEDEINEYKLKGYIYDRHDGYTDKEIEVINILQRVKQTGFEETLLMHYVDAAKQMAKYEYQTGAALLDSTDNQVNQHYRLIFDLILMFKPYVFNMHTIREHQQQTAVNPNEND